MTQVGPRFSIELRSVPFSRALSRPLRMELKMLNHSNGDWKMESRKECTNYKLQNLRTW